MALRRERSRLETACDANLCCSPCPQHGASDHSSSGEVNHRLESRMREIRTSGSEGGGAETIGSPYPIKQRRASRACPSSGRVGRPNRELVQQTPIVVLAQRPHIGRLAAGSPGGVAMRPVATPKDAIRVGRDQRLGERGRVCIIRLRRHAIDAGDLDVSLARPDQLDQIHKARLLEPKRGLGAAEMLEHHRGGATGRSTCRYTTYGFVNMAAISLVSLSPKSPKLFESTATTTLDFSFMNRNARPPSIAPP